MEKDFKNKKIGIWGFGVVGKSALSFFQSKGANISVFDKRELDPFELSLLRNHKVQLIQPDYLTQFLEINDYIFPSPGIDLAPFIDFQDKWLHEVDLFFQYCTQPVIAVTGSVGKTTTVDVITYLLNQLGKKAIACGNIGTGMFDSLPDQNLYDYIVLELSSFQLEHTTRCAPHIAVITNIFPNHLDRHKTIDEYCSAKGNIGTGQQTTDVFIAPLEVADVFLPMETHQIKKWILPSSSSNLDKIDALSDASNSKIRNRELIQAVIESLNLPIETIDTLLTHYQPLEHRMEYVDTINGITFYNDSKATIMESTLSALNIAGRNTILLLGGLSKGIDRSVYIPHLISKTKKIICFGVEAELLAQWCRQNNLNTLIAKTLEEAFELSIQHATQEDTILLSPGGSSYDLFKDYQQSGTLFKKLTHSYKATCILP